MLGMLVGSSRSPHPPSSSSKGNGEGEGLLLPSFIPPDDIGLSSWGVDCVGSIGEGMLAAASGPADDIAVVASLASSWGVMSDLLCRKLH